MAYNRYAISAIIGIIFIQGSLGGLNNCGNVDEAMPAKPSDCFRYITTGAKCCYISAFFSQNGSKLSACVLLPPGEKETMIQKAAQALGTNNTYACEESREEKKIQPALGGFNSCGTVGAAMPAKQSDCLSDKDLNSGALCCYISAFFSLNGSKLSACVLLPPGANQTVIGEAAKALGTNSTYSY